MTEIGTESDRCLGLERSLVSLRKVKVSLSKVECLSGVSLNGENVPMIMFHRSCRGDNVRGREQQGNPQIQVLMSMSYLTSLIMSGPEHSGNIPIKSSPAP